MVYYINQGLSNDGNLMLLAENLVRLVLLSFCCVLKSPAMRSEREAIKLPVFLFDKPLAKFRVARTYHLPNR